MAEALLAGADAFYSVLAGFLPNVAIKLASAARNENRDEVYRIDSELKPLWKLFFEIGSLRIAYAAAAELGLYNAVPPRPILPVSGEDRSRIADALRAVSM
jgi:4-hydroxy-tetrahydrodipicolinate synthase